jgi:peptidoglycan/xylan/chitin deacetylase (PgdA/CDA1 family)
VAVTFDDGYANNLYQAAPLLERHEVPATVFVTTGVLVQNREFWWDELRRLLLRPKTLPERLSLSINGNTYEWKLDCTTPRDNDRLRGLQIFCKNSKHRPTSREAVLHCIHTLLKHSSEEDRRKVLDALAKWASAPTYPRSTHRPLTADEVARLAESKLIDIGAHTVTHPVLSTLSVSMQREEIHGSKTRLEEILGRQVTSFAYPFGSQRDYTSETVRLAQQAGFDCACANFRDVIFSGADCYQLPRIPVRNWEEDEFSRRLGFRL